MTTTKVEGSLASHGTSACGYLLLQLERPNRRRQTMGAKASKLTCSQITCGFLTDGLSSADSEDPDAVAGYLSNKEWKQKHAKPVTSSFKEDESVVCYSTALLAFVFLADSPVVSMQDGLVYRPNASKSDNRERNPVETPPDSPPNITTDPDGAEVMASTPTQAAVAPAHSELNHLQKVHSAQKIQAILRGKAAR